MTGRVLIVDDSAGFRAQARAMLAAAGYEVIGEAEDGRAAMALARRLDPELVVLDVQLPDISGLEVARLLHEETNPPAIILISSREASDYGARVDRSGARGFISKAELSAHAIEVVLSTDGR